MKRPAILLVFLLITTFIYSQSGRVALIIGNSNYLNGAPLKNPENDAIDLENQLSSCGFVIKRYVNLSQTEMKKAIDEFGTTLNDAEIGLFFYAGHGIQSKGRNYLIPIDAALKTENDVEYNCVDAGRILGKMEDAGTRTNIVILDACRDNPFERSWSRKSTGAGLAFMNAPSGSVIAYSTAPGKTASDGYYRNSPYTAGLLKYLQTPNLKIEDFFKLVRSKVREETKGQQTPWEATSLEGNFYFNFDPDNVSGEISFEETLAKIDDISNSESQNGTAQRMGDYETNRKKLAEGIRSIAILPFTDYTGDENNIYLSEGMHDALISELGQLGQVGVTSKTSTLSYADIDKATIKEIAIELNVEGIVETSLIGLGDKIRIQLKLYSAYPEEQLLWSQVFDSDKSDIFGLYDRVIKNIADEIQLSLSPEQESELQNSIMVNPEAYEAYVIGKHYWSLFTPNDLKFALQNFEKASEKDKNFALAYLGISDTWYALYQLGIYSPTDPEPIQNMYIALTKALALDSTLAEVHYSLGNLKSGVDWDWAECLREYDKALSINPNYADAFAAKSNMLALMWRFEEAIDMINIAIELDPQNLFTRDLLGATMLFSRNYDKAISTLQEVMALDPNNFLAMQLIPFAWHMKEEYGKELESWEKFIKTHFSNYQIDYDQIFETDNSKKSYKRAMNKLADELVIQLETGYFDIFIIGMYYASAGNNKKALNMLERAYAEHNPNSPFLVNPAFDDLRSEPRFIELCRKLNLPYN